jgi:hypothetical protein
MGAVRGGSSRQSIAARPAHVVLAPRLGSRDAELLPGDRARRPAGCHRALPGLGPGHSVILPQLLGWTGVVAAQSASESYFLAFLVGLHVATALALMVFYRSDLGEDRARTGRVPADPPHRDARPSPRLAACRDDDPDGVGRPAPRAHPSGRRREPKAGTCKLSRRLRDPISSGTRRSETCTRPSRSDRSMPGMRLGRSAPVEETMV